MEHSRGLQTPCDARVTTDSKLWGGKVSRRSTDFDMMEFFDVRRASTLPAYRPLLDIDEATHAAMLQLRRKKELKP